MKKLLKNKIESIRGFTLAETLLAVLILLLVSTVVATGIPAAKSAYEKVVLASNAEVLLSTTISTLRNELGTAQNVETPNTGGGAGNAVITYYNTTRGAPSKIFKGSDGNDQIMIQRYYSNDGLSKESEAVPLILSKTAAGDFYVTYSSVTCDKGIITFSDLSVKRTTGKESILSRDQLSIRVISYTGD